MERKSHKEISWLQFDLLSSFSTISHGVFLRKGGYSSLPFNHSPQEQNRTSIPEELSQNQLNLGSLVGDNPDHLAKNFQQIQQLFSLPRLHQGVQCHKTHIQWVDAQTPSRIPACDGLITKEPGAALLITHADCQAALFYDPKQHIVAAIHAGWRGNVQRIYEKTLSLFAAAGSCMQDIIVCLSPSLGPDHAEFKNYQTEFPSSFWPYQEKPFFFNLWEIAKQELLSCGIAEKKIEIAKICTYCHPKDFFSFRRDPLTGRNGTIIALKS